MFKNLKIAEVVDDEDLIFLEVYVDRDFFDSSQLYNKDKAEDVIGRDESPFYAEPSGDLVRLSFELGDNEWVTLNGLEKRVEAEIMVSENQKNGAVSIEIVTGAFDTAELHIGAPYDGEDDREYMDVTIKL